MGVESLKDNFKKTERRCRVMSDEIKLSTCRRISNPARKLKRFIDSDDSFELYDLEYVPQDNRLTTTQMWIANAINAQVVSDDVKRLKHRLSEINNALSEIPITSSLTDPEDQIPWDDLENLFSTMMVLGVKEARATKILHKKRPHLIPVLDSVLLKYCDEASKGPLGGTGGNETQKLLAAMEIFKVDLDENREVLDELASSEKQVKDLTLVRRLEILIWAWAGYYRPKWMKEHDWAEVQRECQ